jgi:riboflavin synthase alpha subunit
VYADRHRNKGKIFEVYASAETASWTTLGNLKMGDHVNLEGHLSFGSAGGPIVTGQVDGNEK